MSIFILLMLFVLGLIFGSFVNALVWRLRQQLDDDGNPKVLSKKHKADVSITKGRSMCPQCKQQLAAKDLIPLFSWLSLKGKCRYCKKPISKQYPLIELMTAVLFVMSYIYWPYTLAGFEWVLYIGGLFALIQLIALALYDAKWYILPSKLIYSGLIVYSLALILYSILSNDTDRAGWAFIGALVYATLFLVIYVTSYYANKKGISDKEWLGFGDVRLALLLGLLIGTPSGVFVAIFLGSLIGLVFSMPSLAHKKVTMTTQVPFGPYLIAGAYLALLFSDRLVHWYSSAVFNMTI